MYTPLFWKDAGERAVATAAQFLVGVLTIDNLPNVTMDFRAMAIGAVLAAAVSLLKALVALRFTDGNSASLTVNNVKEK